ncbi:MAG: NAD-dependent epimerase/dehydratase family protein [Candidatus Cloacimonetes bacterium]|nr:NAD-dependent epimerase/dehydratase family protein [Candidatus Cloacimonadota bacterium]
MKIVVTGSRGFIGTRLVPTLTKKDHEVIEIDLKTGYDITNWESIKDLVDFDVIIHLVAISYVPKSYEIPREMFRVNINGTLNMLELCRINKAKFIFTSSYVYGKPKYLPIDEEHPTEAFNPYCQSKLIGEDLCKTYNKDFGVPVIIFRPFNIYGPGQNGNFLIPLIQKQIKDDGIVQLKDPRPKRDYIHVDDVVDAYCKAVKYNKTDFDIFNIGSGTSYSVKEIAEMLVTKSGKNISIEFSEERRENEVLDTVCDNRKTIKKLEIEASLKRLMEK